MAPDFVVPYATLISIGSELSTVSESLNSGDGAAFAVSGLSDPAQAPITSAIDDFREVWEASVTMLGQNIGTLGDISQQIGSMIQQFDDTVAAALRPAGAGA